uniref:G_PROTEIN_RECEP_F1_2 domain-containing protein n=1 Tax=Caenorhabditis tropicalis TaxID=1561998 RepID=A0A1I7UM80_9PELO
MIDEEQQLILNFTAAPIVAAAARGGTGHLMTVDQLFPAHAEIFSDAERPLVQTVILASVLLVLILSCFIGNLFVILAIIMERDLRGRPQYYLIFSLAVADLLKKSQIDHRKKEILKEVKRWKKESHLRRSSLI